MTRTRTTFALGLSLVSAALLMGGCVTGSMLGLGVVDVFPATAGGTSGAVAVGAGALVRNSDFGVRVTVRNESSSDAALRIWVGQVDSREPTGVSDIRTDEDLALVVEPGACAVRTPSKRGWSTARTDAVVWVNIAPADGSGTSQWLAFERPGPFELVLVDADNGQAIDTDRSSTLTDLPTESRIVGRVGELPVWDSADGAG